MGELSPNPSPSLPAIQLEYFPASPPLLDSQDHIPANGTQAEAKSTHFCLNPKTCLPVLQGTQVGSPRHSELADTQNGKERSSCIATRMWVPCWALLDCGGDKRKTLECSELHYKWLEGALGGGENGRLMNNKL